jgi:hypothetical protein
MTIIDDEDVVELPTGNEKIKIEEIVSNVNENSKKNANTRVIREMKKLESWFKLQARKVIQDSDPGREVSLEHVNLAPFTAALIKESSSFEVTINCKKKEDQDAWKKKLLIRNSIKGLKRGTWEVIYEKDVPKD